MEHADPRKIAFVTGASSGIGQAFARRLASKGCNVILVARREQLLGELAHHLESVHSIQAHVIKADLSNPIDITRLEQMIGQLNRLDFLINSAGFAYLGKFVDVPIQQYIDMIECHNLAMVRLCHAAIPGMIARRSGSIINVSSIGAFTAKRGDAVYCATKAFINLFSKTLQSELRDTNVHVQVLCPGFIISGFHDTPSYAPLKIKERIPRFLWNTSDEIVEKSLKALEHNKVIYIPYFKNQAIVTLSQIGLIEVLTAVLVSFFKHSRSSGSK